MRATSEHVDAGPVVKESFPRWFTESGRMKESGLKRLSKRTAGHPALGAVLDSALGFAVVLNRHRQVIAANSNFLAALGLDRFEGIRGLRIGEALGCENAAVGPDGCGTSERCRHCGHAAVVLAAQTEARPAVGDCSIRLKRNGVFECLEFRIRASPFNIGRHRAIIHVFNDNSALKRRKILEQTFLHDLRSLFNGLNLWGRDLQTLPDPATAGRLARLAGIVNREVEGHLCLLEAESGRLSVNRAEVPVGGFFDDLAERFSRDAAEMGKRLYFHPEGRSAFVRTDPDLLRRILTNMILNALEAAPGAGRVHIDFGYSNSRPRFSVNNQGVMDPAVQARIFTCSFSTRRQGRGLGTYTMKLLGETYLKGEVGFTSNPKDGTTFYFCLPPG